MEMTTDVNGETFAVYLAKTYIAKHGYKHGTVPEAMPLLESCDIVLTFMDGLYCKLLCIVDRDANPDRRFGSTPAEVEDICKQCMCYTGMINHAKIAAQISILEIGGSVDEEKDVERLSSFKRSTMFTTAGISAWLLDTKKLTVWTNSMFNGYFTGRRDFETLLRSPRATDEEMYKPAVVFADRAKQPPILTYGLLAVMALVFVAEQLLGIGASDGLSPNIQTLMAMGGLNKTVVLQSGGWHRLLTSAFLHGGIMHLLLNSIALFFVGSVIERILGKTYLFGLFFLSALGGSMLSMALNPDTVVTVGASGAIMGLLAALFVFSFRFPIGTERAQLQMTSMQMLIPSLLPILFSGRTGEVDYAAHLGGACVGALFGWIVLKTWSDSEPLPRLRGLAKAVAVAGVAAFSLAAYPVTQEYASFALDEVLIPENQLSKQDSVATISAAELVSRYPHDPRSHLALAEDLIKQQDFLGAEKELRTGLSDDQILKSKFKPDLEIYMRTKLALLLVDKGEPAEAKVAARYACATALAENPIRKYLVQAQLCD